MVGLGKANRARASVAVRCDADADIYDRHADGLYRQALLTLGESMMYRTMWPRSHDDTSASG